MKRMQTQRTKDLNVLDLKTGEGKQVEVLSKKNGAIEGGIGSKAEARVPAFPHVPADLMWKEVQPEVVPRVNGSPTGSGKKTKTSPKKCASTPKFSYVNKIKADEQGVALTQKETSQCTFVLQRTCTCRGVSRNR